MTNDPRDPVAYRIAIATLGVALVVAVAGIPWIHLDEGKASVPVELWFTAGILGGVFVGVLLPFSLQVRSSRRSIDGSAGSRPNVAAILGAAVLGLFFTAAVLLGALKHDLAFWAAAATIGGVLLGLPVPSPGRRD